jgi:Domain of unknown function (DUF4124)
VIYTYCMTRYLITSGSLLTLTLVLFTQGATATTIYRTTGADGEASFSDTPPQNGTQADEVEIEVTAPIIDQSTQQRLANLRETTDRMVADRMAREKHRAELRQLQAEAERRQQQVLANENGDYYNNGYERDYYYPRRYLGPIRHGRRLDRKDHRKEHRGIYPAPPLQVNADYNNYPASLIRRSYNPQVRRAFRKPKR